MCATAAVNLAFLTSLHVADDAIECKPTGVLRFHYCTRLPCASTQCHPPLTLPCSMPLNMSGLPLPRTVRLVVCRKPLWHNTLYNATCMLLTMWPRAMPQGADVLAMPSATHIVAHLYV